DRGRRSRQPLPQRLVELVAGQEVLRCPFAALTGGRICSCQTREGALQFLRSGPRGDDDRLVTRARRGAVEDGPLKRAHVGRANEAGPSGRDHFPGSSRSSSIAPSNNIKTPAPPPQAAPPASMLPGGMAFNQTA